MTENFILFEFGTNTEVNFRARICCKWLENWLSYTFINLEHVYKFTHHPAFTRLVWSETMLYNNCIIQNYSSQHLACSTPINHYNSQVNCLTFFGVGALDESFLTNCSASVPFTRCFTGSKTLRFLVAVFWQISWCFCMRSFAKFLLQILHSTKSSLGGPEATGLKGVRALLAVGGAGAEVLWKNWGIISNISVMLLKAVYCEQ